MCKLVYAEWSDNVIWASLTSLPLRTVAPCGTRELLKVMMETEQEEEEDNSSDNVLTPCVSLAFAWLLVVQFFFHIKIMKCEKLLSFRSFQT